MRLVLASNNAGKAAEFATLLGGIEVLPQSAFDVPACDEPASTFVENALIKARHAAAHSGLPALADDSGLCVAALAGAPGVRSARYADGGGDAANNTLLLQRMQGVADRRAHFACVLVALRGPDDPEPLIAHGRLDGRIADAPAGEGGFGYDPLFELADGRTLAQLSREHKNRISHRAMASARLLELLRGAWGVGA